MFHLLIHISASISQLIIFNSVKNMRDPDSSHHRRDHEPPLPLYIAMKVHAVTRKRTLVDALYNLGMCVSYTVWTSDVGNGVCECFMLDGVVCPPTVAVPS